MRASKDPSLFSSQVDELQAQYQQEASRSSRVEEANRQLKEKLASAKTLSRSHDQLERSNRQLEEEVAGLRRQLQASVMDQSQAEQYRRETEERARQEIRHKLEEVNLFLQVHTMGIQIVFNHIFVKFDLILNLFPSDAGRVSGGSGADESR